MAKSFLSPINMNQLEIQNMALQNLGTDPHSGTEVDGEIYLHTGTGRIRYWDGSVWQVIAVGSGLSDGDKGDITVSSSGTVWTIDNSAVTYAKIQDVSATNRLLGRFSSGAGVVEEVTLGTGFTFSTGALSYTAGTDTQVLFNDGGVISGEAGMTYDKTTDTLTLVGNVVVADEAYGAGWDGSLEVPTKNAVYDKVEAILLAGGYDDEAAQDAIGGILVDSSTIDFTYDDGTPSITAIVIDDSITYAKMQNIGNLTVIGRTSGGTGDPEAVTVVTDIAANGTATNVATSQAIIDYVTNVVGTGIRWHESVRVMSTADVVIASALENGDTLNGVTLVTGDRVLLAFQSDATENGVYTVVASGAASRSTAENTGAELVNSVYWVREGTLYGDTAWTVSNDAITLGSTSITVSQVAGYLQATTTRAGISELATDAETLAMSSTTVVVTPSNLAALDATEAQVGMLEVATQTETNTGTADDKIITPLKLKTWFTGTSAKFTQDIGNGAATSFDIDHNFGTKDVDVRVYDNTTGEEYIVDNAATTINRVVVTPAVVLTTNQARVVVRL